VPDPCSTPARFAEIPARLAEVRSRIAHAAGRAHRTPDSVRLVLASKTQPPAAIAAAYHAGARDFGENYVQEAASKRSSLPALSDLRWHLIGHLQTNKVRAAIEVFALIQTLDNVRLAAALHRLRPAPPMPVLLEINLAEEGSKNGVAPVEAEVLIEAVRGSVEVNGLMTVPPPSADPEITRPYFARLREMRDRLAVISGLPLRDLSMGMTNDYEVAIEEGATIVRVGRAVFGERR
jgi:PLP dependent protein